MFLPLYRDSHVYQKQRAALSNEPRAETANTFNPLPNVRDSWIVLNEPRSVGIASEVLTRQLHQRNLGIPTRVHIVMVQQRNQFRHRRRITEHAQRLGRTTDPQERNVDSLRYGF